MVRTFARLRSQNGQMRHGVVTRAMALHNKSPQHVNGGSVHLLTSLLSGYLAPYLGIYSLESQQTAHEKPLLIRFTLLSRAESTPSAEAAINAIEGLFPDAPVAFDHFAFRTYGVEPFGIRSMSRWFTDLGYSERGTLEFEKKQLRAIWLSPPATELPRIFISELKVEELSSKSQRIIEKYTCSESDALGRYGPVTGLLGVTPWTQPPSFDDYKALEEESEYAAWVLIHGYALNHTTVAVHRLKGLVGGIELVNAKLKEKGLELNTQGGEVKVSADGLLLQSSTIADTIEYEFADTEEAAIVPASYIEMAERKVLPEYAHLNADEIQEFHRRDGFETASADRIFESTTVAAKRLGQAASP